MPGAVALVGSGSWRPGNCSSGSGTEMSRVLSSMHVADEEVGSVKTDAAARADGAACAASRT